MKKIVILLMGMIVFNSLSAQEGTLFLNLSFQEAINKAKDDNKYIFIDCYTSWCTPCKQMEKEIFPKIEMGNYLNEKFVCVKYDMEKGEGPDLSDKLSIGAYPTFVILNSDGDILHKLVGSTMDVQKFIDKIEEAFDETKASGILYRKYVDGDRSKEFLKKYVIHLLQLNDPNTQKVVDEYMNTLNNDEKLASENMLLYMRYSPIGSANETFLIENREKFHEIGSKDIVETTLSHNYLYYFMKTLYQASSNPTSIIEIEEIKDRADKLDLLEKDLIDFYYLVAKAITNNDVDLFLGIYEEYQPKMKDHEIDVLFNYSGKSVAKIASEKQMEKWYNIIRDDKLRESLSGFINK